MTYALLVSLFRGARKKLRRATLSLVISVCPFVHPSGRNNSAPTRRIFMKYISVLFENLSWNFEFHSNLRRIMGILHEDQYEWLIRSRSLLRRMRNVSDKRCRENQNKNFMFDNPFSERRAVYEIMLKNTVEPERSQMTIRRMRIACRIHKATNIHSEYVILIAFSLQQWLHARALMLDYTYEVC
jgi:hypothetical protein